jgi:hypothetical protein
MIGVEIAKLYYVVRIMRYVRGINPYPLLRQNQIHGPPRTEFIPSAAWKSPSLAAPMDSAPDTTKRSLHTIAEIAYYTISLPLFVELQRISSTSRLRHPG